MGDTHSQYIYIAYGCLIQLLIVIESDFFIMHDHINIVLLHVYIYLYSNILSIPTALGDLTDPFYALGGDDPTLCSSTTNMNHTNPLRNHRTLDTALSPESSILSGVSQSVSSVREREMHHQSSSSVVAAVSSGEMYSIYDDPQYDTPEQRVPESESELIKYS